MKEVLIIVLTIASVFTACKPSSEEEQIELDQAAKSLCNCMKEKEGEPDLEMMNFGICAAEASVDLRDSGIGEALEKECVEIKEVYDRFLKENIEK